jgi:hypothetical protein
MTITVTCENCDGQIVITTDSPPLACPRCGQPYWHQLPRYHDEDYERAAKLADEAFWKAVTECFPDIKTGDFPPDAQYRWDFAVQAAISTWVQTNGISG